MRAHYLEMWRTYREEGLGAFIARCAPDVVAEEYRGAPGAQAWHGHEGVRALFDRWQQDFDGFQFEPAGDPVQIGEYAFANPVRVRGTGRGSGIEVDWTLVMASVLRDDGLVAHIFLVDSVEEARERVS